MIRYSKEFWSVSSLFTWYGSAVPRALPFALCAALVAGLCAGFASDRLAGLWGHPYPYQMFAFIVGFLVVFRCVWPSRLCQASSHAPVDFTGQLSYGVHKRGAAQTAPRAEA